MKAVICVTTIESLYYGNINPSERSVRRGSEYDRLLGVLTQSEDTLAATLTPAQKAIFDRFVGSSSDLNSINEVTAFTLGFRLGLQLTAEALLPIKTDTEPIIE